MPKTQKRRRNEKKTNYSKRLELLKSGKARAVIRKTNKYIILQIIASNETRDEVIVGASSKDLINLGWSESLKGSLKTLPACYLTGLLVGKKLLEKSKDKIILDLGLQRNVHGGRIYAALKGLIDAGVKINANEKVFPSEDRINGKHLKEDVQKVFQEVVKKLR